MGRYAFFNTEFEYKFGFAVQESEDITTFLGDPVIHEEDDGPAHRWNMVEDGELVLIEIRRLEEDLKLPELDFTTFSPDLDGTYALRDHIRTLFNSTEKAHWRYLLGVLIYHQLIYQEDLEATYED